MPSAYDSLRAICCEEPSTGGTQARTSATELDPTSDALAAAGLHLVGNSASPNDKTTYLDRTSGGLRLTDATTQRQLAELMCSVSGGLNSHESSRDIEHFLAGGGPGYGVAPSGAYLQRVFNGPLLTSETWYTTSNATTKILSRTLTYPSGSVLPSSQTIVVYSPSGVALRSCQDAYSYSGPLLTSSTRSWS